MIGCSRPPRLFAIFMRTRESFTATLNQSEISFPPFFAFICSYLVYRSSNILLTSENRVKITDFGLSKYLDKTKSTVTFGGTFYYMSPEIFEESSHSFNTDVWFELYSILKCFNKTKIVPIIQNHKRSLGCVLYELIVLEYAFPKGLFLDGQLNKPAPIPDLRNTGQFRKLLKE